MLKTPRFWFKKDSVLALILSPISKLYEFSGHLIQKKAKPVSVKTPLICIGNATLGGGGKTPTAIAVGKILDELNLKYGFLTRGYKGETKGPFRVNALYHTAKQMGDESLILGKTAITYVAKDRVKGAQKMDRLGLNAVVLDDGYQNPKLKKDISLLVVNGIIGFGNEAIFPSGPLRESIEDAVKKADAVIIIGDVSEQVSNFIKTVTVPVFFATVQSFFPKEIDKTTKLLAFCGLAFPKKFFNSLEDQGFNVLKKIPFSDHHLYTERDVSDLREKARSLGAKLITTEKDYVRLSKTQKKYVTYVPIELCWKDKKEVKAFLNKKIKLCQEKTS